MARTQDQGQRQNKQERAYTTLRGRILDGEYGPGYRLVIDALAEELGVSAVPVREAIRRLEAEGLVAHRPNVSAQVAAADPTQYEDSIEILAVLQGYATALAAPHLEREQMDELVRWNATMEQCMEQLDSVGFSQANREFHRVIEERCPNPFLVDSLGDIADRLDAVRRTVFMYFALRGWESIEEHRGLIELIRTQAPFDEIEAATRAHTLNTLEAFRRRDASAQLGRAGEAP